jgi:hypothetical protein
MRRVGLVGRSGVSPKEHELADSLYCNGINETYSSDVSYFTVQRINIIRLLKLLVPP